MTPIRIYWAGGLFDHKELMGNWHLARAVERVCAGRYSMVLPQDAESGDARGLNLRDGDFDLLLTCDGILVNFDGTELDSGTVAEFMFAHMLGMPSVQFRTDFREAGDEKNSREPWNLMLKGYPRSVPCVVNALTFYQENRPDLFPEIYYERLAQKLTAALDEAWQTPPVFSAAELPQVYRNVIHAVGGELESVWNAERIAGLLAAKASKRQAGI